MNRINERAAAMHAWEATRSAADPRQWNDLDERDRVRLRAYLVQGVEFHRQHAAASEDERLRKLVRAIDAAILESEARQ